MEGGTTFYFVTDGIQSALKQAKQAAGDKDIRVGGGTAVVRDYLKAGLVDEIHLAVSPVLLGAGENLLAGLNLPQMGYRRIEHAPSQRATHVVFTKEAK
jgi:dihydrofolate reductase